MKMFAGKLAETASSRRRVLNLVLLGLGALALIYVFLLASTVFNIVERRALEAEARTLSNEVGDLELAYFSAISKIDPSYSAALGFGEVKAKFVKRIPSEHLTADGGGIAKNEI